MPAWQDLTSTQIGELTKDPNLVAILPVGATEQHGPHLATGTDTICADRIAHLAAEKSRALVLPTLPYGCSLGHGDAWPGTLTLHPTTLTMVVVEIARWAVKSGVRKLLMLSGHVTNAPCLASAILQLRYEFPETRFRQLGLWDVSERAMQLYTRDAADFHANHTETSIMLHLAPHGVQMEHARDVADVTPGLVWNYPMAPTTKTGVVGYPTRAGREDGEMVTAALVDDLTALVQAATHEAWPLR